MLARLLLAMLLPILSEESDTDDDMFEYAVAPASAATPALPQASAPSAVEVRADANTQMPPAPVAMPEAHQLPQNVLDFIRWMQEHEREIQAWGGMPAVHNN